MNWRPIEWYAGLGGLAAAWPEADICAAIDISQTAQQVYRANFEHPFFVREVASIDATEVASWEGNFWWLSPPCQPYTKRGLQLGEKDDRAKSLFRLIELLAQLRPEGLALENVVGFEHSAANQLLISELQRLDYNVASLMLCPTQFGIPNLRRRYYCIASQQALKPWQSFPKYSVDFAKLLEPVGSESSLWLSPEVAAENWSGLSRIFHPIDHEISSVDSTRTVFSPVQRVDPSPVTACFGSSYGKSILRSGSYLVAGDRVRRFSPREVARLLGFPESFQLKVLSDRNAWKLLGNSLSIPVIRYVLSHFQHGLPSPTISADRLPPGYCLV